MDTSTIFGKTSAGTQAIRKNGSSLSRVQEDVLLWVDGRRTVADIYRLAVDECADVFAILVQLKDMGIIAPVFASSRVPTGLRRPSITLDVSNVTHERRV